MNKASDIETLRPKLDRPIHGVKKPDVKLPLCKILQQGALCVTRFL